MQTLTVIAICLFILSLGMFISVIRYIVGTKREKDVRALYACKLIEFIMNRNYKEPVMYNDYPCYPGELEAQDEEEYSQFLTTGILEHLK